MTMTIRPSHYTASPRFGAPQQSQLQQQQTSTQVAVEQLVTDARKRFQAIPRGKDHAKRTQQILALELQVLEKAGAIQNPVNPNTQISLQTLKEEHAATVKGINTGGEGAPIATPSRLVSTFEHSALSSLFLDLGSQNAQIATNAETALKTLGLSPEKIQGLRTAVTTPKTAPPVALRFSGVLERHQMNAPYIFNPQNQDNVLFGQAIEEIAAKNSVEVVTEQVAEHQMNNLMGILQPAILFGCGGYRVDHYEKGYPVRVWDANM